MPKMKINITNGIGVERELTLPAKFEVCDRCQGEGKHVNPNVDGHGLSREDFDQDPDFEEAYFSGVYDVTCYTCKGEKVMPTIDYDAMRDRPVRRLGLWVTGKSRERLLKRIHDSWEADADYEAMCEMERRYGC